MKMYNVKMLKYNYSYFIWNIYFKNMYSKTARKSKPKIWTRCVPNFRL